MGNLQLKEEYRQLRKESFEAIRLHKGSRKSYETLFAVLTKLERWIGKNFENGATRASDETEELVALEYTNSKFRTINDFLACASSRIEKLVRGELSPKQIADQLSIVYQELDKPLLPTEDTELQRSVEGKGKYHKPRYIPKLQMLIGILQKMEILCDDILLTSGINSPNMMRREGYTLIEIPKKGKEILICNESGQATYLSHFLYGADTYMELSKKTNFGALWGMQNKLYYRSAMEKGCF